MHACRISLQLYYIAIDKMLIEQLAKALSIPRWYKALIGEYSLHA